MISFGIASHGLPSSVVARKKLIGRRPIRLSGNSSFHPEAEGQDSNSHNLLTVYSIGICHKGPDATYPGMTAKNP